MIDCAVPCTVKARRWRSSANVKQQRSLLGFGISVHQCSSAVEENSLTRAQPPHPPRPLLPQPKPWGRRGAKRGQALDFRRYRETAKESCARLEFVISVYQCSSAVQKRRTPARWISGLATEFD